MGNRNDFHVFGNGEMIPVMYKEDVVVLVDQLKQYVHSEKQIVKFTNFANFPSKGKENLYYIAMNTMEVYIWDSEVENYKEFIPKKIVTENDYILLNAGGAGDSFGF